MNKFTLIMVLMLIPFASHAEWSGHSKHRNHEHRHNNSYFWQDVEHRQYRQQSRIDRGIDKGQLTRREIKKLRREQKHIAKQVRNMKRHNYLNKRDKREVMEHLDFVSDKIRTLKHNKHYARRNRSSHDGHNQHVYSNENRNYRSDRYLSWANSDSSAGIYFRF